MNILRLAEIFGANRRILPAILRLRYGAVREIRPMAVHQGAAEEEQEAQEVQEDTGTVVIQAEDTRARQRHMRGQYIPGSLLITGPVPK